ncbi:long-chain fatty acid--CoA ligase [Cupriavidus sp. SK-3]|uniref:AMP-binding protein n=1 Tax=Cupriavidus TaxID=106589 RepID=UPI00045193BA|nr:MULTISPECIES: AMP-binding protein [Cupriavidus]KDP87421.1 long-chain fatty acid--CoA ligase [Cupriavidus sp. SK-3]MDF3884996.1 AMP-binding protein [Cupriavidus basilensis]
MVASLQYGETRFDGAEIERRAAQVASGLAALGVGEDDVVAIVLRNAPALFEITLACNHVGAYHCPVDWRFTVDELGYILQDSGACVLFIEADLLATLHAAIPERVRVLAVTPEPLALQAYTTSRVTGEVPTDALRYGAWRSAQAAYSGPSRRPRGRFAYTSGTTGRPKGVRRLAQGLHPEQPRLLRDTVKAVFDFSAEARVYLSAPLYHGAPNLYGVQAMLATGLVVLDPRFDAEATLRAIERHRITHLYLVPTMCVRLLSLAQQVRNRYDLSSIRFVACTGAPFAVAVKQAMIDWWGPVINESYASSEMGMVTVISSADAIRKPGSVGRPVSEAEVRIYSDAGCRLGTGEVGNIHVRQPAYADFTYHNRPEARAAIDCEGLACVGDMGYVDTDGFLFICDRKSDMVISGGVNIYPAEIENALSGMPGVADCAAFGVPHEEFGEMVVAVVQPADGARLDPEGMRAWLKDRLAAYKVPKVIELRTELPRQESGKIHKRKLRDGYWQHAGRRI